MNLSVFKGAGLLNKAAHSPLLNSKFADGLIFRFQELFNKQKTTPRQDYSVSRKIIIESPLHLKESYASYGE